MATKANLASTLETILKCGENVAAFLPKNGVISQMEFDRLAGIVKNHGKLISRIDEVLEIRNEKERANALDELAYCNPLAQELIELRRAV